MQHTGLRPVTHHTTPSCRIGWLYTYPTNWFFHLPMVSTKPCGQKAIFSHLTTYRYNIPVHWVWIKPTTQDSQSQTQTTQPGAENVQISPLSRTALVLVLHYAWMTSKWYSEFWGAHMTICKGLYVRMILPWMMGMMLLCRKNNPLMQ